jgi:hypothetical protein
LAVCRPRDVKHGKFADRKCFAAIQTTPLDSQGFVPLSFQPEAK